MEKAFRIKLIITISLGLLLIGGIACVCVGFLINSLQEIYIKTNPNKMIYYETEEFDSTGIKVIAKYHNFGVEKEVENFEIFVDSPLTTQSNNVIISYTEKGVTKTTILNIQVKPRIITELVVTSEPKQTQYFVGDFFNMEGLQLLVNCQGNAKSFEPKDIKIDKFNIPLTKDDKYIIISYTERNVTLSTKINIQVLDKNLEDEQLKKVIELFNLLPAVEQVTLEHEKAILYLEDEINKLTQEQKDKINAITRLQKYLDKIEELKQERELILNKEYHINYFLKNGDYDFEHENQLLYKNAYGQVKLKNAISQELYDLGYDFSHWENEDGNIIAQLENIDNDLNLYAVFELSKKVKLKFINYETAQEIGVYEINRFNGVVFEYNLLNQEINNFIYNLTKQISIEFYLNDSLITKVDTKDSRIINIAVKTKSVETIIEESDKTPSVDNAIFVYGDNVSEYALVDNKLSTRSLSDIANYYNEKNRTYINYYIIDSQKKTYEDLENITFDINNNKVVVVQEFNEFDLVIQYNEGQKTYVNLVGRQSIENALIEFAKQNEEEINFINALKKYFDLSQILVQDTILQIPNRQEFIITLNDDEIVSQITVPNYEMQYVLTDNLPSLDKKGYIFLGWALEKNGTPLNNEYLNIIVQNNAEDMNLYAVWEIDENIELPQDKVNYSEKFVGVWSSKLSYKNSILDIILLLNSDGTYNYQIYSNNEINIELEGEYRFIDNKLEIYWVKTLGDYQIIRRYDISFNLDYVEDNIMIANAFYLEKDDFGINIDFFAVVLIKDKACYKNYYSEDCIGSYKFNYIDEITQEQNQCVITLINNGIATIKINDKEYEGYFRIVNGRIILISNIFSGTKDITDYLIEENKVQGV